MIPDIYCPVPLGSIELIQNFHVHIEIKFYVYWVVKGKGC